MNAYKKGGGGLSKYTYTYHRDAVPKQELHYYSRDELELMTTYQLRDICYRERIINGIHAPLDKDVLIREILRFRGRADRLFITESTAEGTERLETLLATARLNLINTSLQGCAKLIVYHGISVEYFDRYTIGYKPELVDTNALLVSGGKICAIFNLRTYQNELEKLFITKTAGIACEESTIRNYSLFCMDRKQSDLLYRIYRGETSIIPEHLTFYTVPVLNFEVRPLLESRMPLAIDFGSSNTTAGIYLDSAYFEQVAGDPIAQILKRDQVNYVFHLNVESGDTVAPVLPSAVAVVGVNGQNIQYRFGYEANRLFHFSYIDEGFCVFYDLKRWVGDADRLEEVVDRQGHRSFVSRKEIIQAYLEYVIECARQRFKCNFKSIHISAPVKQKPLFIQLFQEILPNYRLESENMLDEGVAVLYNTISTRMKENRFKDGETYRALIIDCGGGTTDLSSCRFQITDRRVAYQIDIATAYENGNTDFGGNNLTYRILQLLKLAIARQLSCEEFPDVDELIRNFDVNLFRTVDDQGVDQVYAKLDESYARAEQVIPTRFRDYEHKSRADYYAVKNNFYFLFQTAERIKTSFYSHTNLLRMAVSSVPIQETATQCMLVDRWKLSAFQSPNESLEVMKEIPTVYLNIYTLNLLLQADIYGIVRQFMEGPYTTGELPEYSILKLTGQSCKIDIFRDALKEFIPGKMIQSSRNRQGREHDYDLKLTCLNGAIEYLKDKMFGYADVNITHEQAAFPYVVTAFTHTNQEVTLIHSLDRENIRGFISRNMADLTLKLYLKDLEGRQRYIYSCSCDPDRFKNQKAEEIVNQYHGQIRQDDLDDIVDRELKFFILADEHRWGFTVVPVLRRKGQLQLGPDQFFRFETEGWLTNFFDGTK